MKEITFRFLNFVLYSFLFYSNIQGFIKDKNLNKYLIKSMTCFEIMEENWKKIIEILQNIPVEIFLNLIYDEIINKFIECPILKTKEDAIKFEKSVNEFIINKIQDKNAIKDLMKKNDDIIKVSPKTFKSIVQELFPYNIYPENDFPDYKYFYLSELPGKEHFILQFNSKEKNKEKYPILNIIINNDILKEKIELMKYLPTLNKVCNYMINYVSFKYSREEAKKILINGEINEEKISKLLDEFVLNYQKIRPFIKKQGSHEFNDLFIDLNNNLYLSNLCVDSRELGFGLILLAIYEKMIEWQNSFINIVVNSSNEKLKNYKNLYNSGVMIQDCEKENILRLPSLDFNIKKEKNENNNFEDFDFLEIILDNSIRKDNKVIYNFDGIEDELASNILPKIKYFKSEIRKVIYQYDFFIEDRSSIIINFMEKYPQRLLDDKELKNVVNYILEKKKDIKFDIIKYSFSLQFLIDIILDFNPDIDITLYSFIENNNKLNNSNIEIIKDLFNQMKENMQNDNDNNNEIDNYFTINCLLNLIDIVELFSWEAIKKNLDKKYFEDINQNNKLQFDNYYNSNLEENNNIIIKKVDLCSAIRKFITRYLYGKKDEYLKPKKKLNNYLINIEFWPINFAEDDIIKDEINSIFGKEEIEIEQAVKLYEYLGGDIYKLDVIIKKYVKKEKKQLEDKDIKKYNEFENIKIIKDNENEINSKEKNDFSLFNDDKDNEEKEKDIEEKDIEEKDEEEENEEEKEEEKGDEEVLGEHSYEEEENEKITY